MLTDRECLRLYAVTDRANGEGRPFMESLEQVLEGGVTMVQLREKEIVGEDFLTLALNVKALCVRFDVPLVINDNLDVAIQSGADGVHLGQEDLSVEEARARAGRFLIIGASVRTVEEALAAERQGADYLGVGAVFPSPTKPDAARVTEEELRRICGAVSIPAVAIGGIDRGNLHKLRGTGIAGVAVASALFSSADPRDSARKLRSGMDDLLSAEKGK